MSVQVINSLADEDMLRGLDDAQRHEIARAVRAHIEADPALVVRLKAAVEPASDRTATAEGIV